MTSATRANGSLSETAPHAPAPLRELIERLLETDAGARIQSATELLDALAAVAPRGGERLLDVGFGGGGYGDCRLASGRIKSGRQDRRDREITVVFYPLEDLVDLLSFDGGVETQIPGQVTVFRFERVERR